MKYILAILLILVISIISIILGAYNNQLITFNYLFAQSQFHLSTLLITVFISGFIISWIICALFCLRMHVALLLYKRKIKRLQKTLINIQEIN